jgi:hypothetical protein
VGIVFGLATGGMSVISIGLAKSGMPVSSLGLATCGMPVCNTPNNNNKVGRRYHATRQ